MKYFILITLIFLLSLITHPGWAQKPDDLLSPTLSTVGDNIYLFEGKKESALYSNELWKVYTKDDVSWSDLQSIPTNIVWTKLEPTGDLPPETSEHSAVVNGDDIYIIGGLTYENGGNENADLDVFKYSATNNSWAKIIPSSLVNPKRMNSHASQYIGGALYVSFQNQMWRLILATNAWERLSDCPYYVPENYNLQWHSTAVFEDNFYVLSGGFGMGSKIYKYDPIANTWSQIETDPGLKENIQEDGFLKSNSIDDTYDYPPPMAGSFSWLTSSHWFILCAGRNLITREFPETAWAFDFVMMTWTKLDNYIFPRYDAAGTASPDGSDFAFVYGGTAMDDRINYYGLFEKINIELPARDKAKLTLSIDPSPAGSSTTSPTPGEHEYEFGAPVQIEALPDEENGWNFLKWTGAAGGNPTSLTMDADKNVIAHFVKPSLRFELDAPELKILSPSEVMENPELEIMTIKMIASQEDSWLVNKLTLKNTKDKVDIKKALITLSDGREVEGIASSDTSEFTFTFTPNSILVPKAGQIFATLGYVIDLALENQSCEMAETREYQAKLDGPENVHAVPEHYSYGQKYQMELESKQTFIACIKNTNEYVFQNIDDAVRSETTDRGHEVLLYPGTYRQNIKIEKPVTIRTDKEWGKSQQGSSDIAIITEKIDYEPTFKIFGLHTNVTLSDLDFSQNNECAINLVYTRNTIIENCIFKSNKNSIFGKSADSIVIKNSVFSFGKSIYIKLESCGAITIDSCTFNKNENSAIKLYNGNGIISNCLFLDSGESEQIYSHGINRNWKIQKCHFTDINHSGIYSYDHIYKIREGSILEINDCEFSAKTDSAKAIINFNAKLIFKGNNLKGFRNGIWVVDSKGGIIENNKIIALNSSTGRAQGILIIDCSNYKINNNRIYGTRNSNYNVDGILLNETDWSEIHNNRISGMYTNLNAPSSAISLVNKSHMNDIKGNYLVNNCEGIRIINSPSKNFIGSNFISDCLCFATGIHSENSQTQIKGNHFTNNAGADLGFSGLLAPKKMEMNNFNNSEKAIINNSPVTINANNNYWGQSTGPTSNSSEGNVTIYNWLSSANEFIACNSKDTIYTPVGQSDSVDVLLVNFKNISDAIAVEFFDENGWITNNTQHQATLDTTGVSIYQSFIAPQNEGTNQLIAKCQSESNAELNDSDTTILCSYIPKLNKIEALPQYAIIEPNDTIRIDAYGYDQHERIVSFMPEWSSTVSMDSNSFTSSNEGIFEVIIKDASGGISTLTKIAVTTEEEQLSRINLVEDSVTLYPGDLIFLTVEGFNQFDFPMTFSPGWKGTGGETNFGSYIAGTTPGKYSITVFDSITGLKDSCIVDIISAPSYLVAITLATDTIWLATGERYALEAFGWDQYGNEFNEEFIWEIDGGSFDDGIFTAGNSPGEYEIIVSNADKSVQRKLVVIISASNSVKNFDKSNLLKVYPNPTKNKLHIESKELLSEIKVLSISGQLIAHKMVGGNRTTVTIEQSGIYFIEVKANNFCIVQKVIVE